MLSKIFAGLVRHRRPVLAAAVVLCVTQFVAELAGSRIERGPLQLLTFGVLFALWNAILLVLIALLLWLIARPHRPAVFLIDRSSSAFATPAGPSHVALTLLFIFLASLQSRFLVDGGPVAWLLGTFFLAGVALHIVAAWRGIGIWLTPEGVYYRDFIGSLTVPWSALAHGQPYRPAIKDTTLHLPIARPELVRRRGFLIFGSRRLRIDNVHAWFITDAIRHYATYPEHRTAIGTPGEYHRLLAALRAPSTASSPR